MIQVHHSNKTHVPVTIVLSKPTDLCLFYYMPTRVVLTWQIFLSLESNSKSIFWPQQTDNYTDMVKLEYSVHNGGITILNEQEFSFILLVYDWLLHCFLDCTSEWLRLKQFSVVFFGILRVAALATHEKKIKNYFTSQWNYTSLLEIGNGLAQTEQIIETILKHLKFCAEKFPII